jgi:hypothetical protein
MISTLRAYDVVHKALRVTGVVGLGDAVDPLVSQEALMLLNGMRAEWSLNVKNYAKYDQTYTATGDKQFITLGIDSLGIPGDIASRPNEITHIVIINGDPTAANNNFPIEIRPYSDYRNLVVQNIFAVPQIAYVDTEYPLQNVYLYPGLSSGWSVRVIGSKYMTEYENIADNFIDPPEYFDALYLNLALRLAPLYGSQLNDGVVQQAAGALKHIKHHMLMTRMGIMPNGLHNQGTGVNFQSGLSY